MSGQTRALSEKITVGESSDDAAMAGLEVFEDLSDGAGVRRDRCHQVIIIFFFF